MTVATRTWSGLASETNWNSLLAKARTEWQPWQALWSLQGSLSTKYALSPSLQRIVDQMRSSAAKPPRFGGQWTTQCDFNELTRVFGNAWVGTPTRPGEPLKAWLTRHIDYPCQQSRVEMSHYYMGVAVAQSLRDGALVLGQTTTTGQLASAVLLSEKANKNLNSNYSEDENDSSSSLWSHLWELNVTLRLSRLPVPTLLQCPKYQLQQSASLIKSAAWSKLKHARIQLITVLPPSIQALPALPSSLSYWYIDMIASCPTLQGQGHGHSLMKQICVLADTAAKAVHLEAAGPVQVAWYEQHGFTIVHEYNLDDPTDINGTPLQVCLMVREPQNKRNT